MVREGQRVNQGDVLFEIDPVPFRLAVDQAKAVLEQAKTTYKNLVANVKIYDRMVGLMQQSIDLKQKDVDRKSTLAKSNFGSQLDLDNASTALSRRKRNRLSFSSSFQRQDPVARVTPICRLSNFHPIIRPRPRSRRPNAISTIP